MPGKTTNRLFVSVALNAGAELRLDEDRSHYVARVLRLRSGDSLTLFDGAGGEAPAVIDAVSRREVRVRVGPRCNRSAESSLSVHLIQGISRGERMDFVVQKATELGVHRISPVASKRSVVKLDGEKGEKRALHWAKVAQSACEQCGRNIVPAIDAPQLLDDWLSRPTPADTRRIVLHPGAGQKLATVSPLRQVALLVGPEGGLDDSEHACALAAGFEPCSLGPRILRTETAAIAALAVLQSHHGDL